ncbi:MAG TPA: AarF/ABC1/UbiB kinase family protein [Candidatus Manganitrophaceae bacterium]|nr:AarF/ABC1/UbiB kinase family protein [Candidatus Manganitrophaceae bacterium]
MDHRLLLLKWTDLNRLKTIVRIVFESGGSLLIRRLQLKYFVPLRLRLRAGLGRVPDARLLQIDPSGPFLSPPLLRSLLERLGPTYVKLGQVLSMRADLVGESISRELSKLQSDVSPFPYEEAHRIMTEEFGAPPETLFKSFEEKPVAAGSLAQVHRALLIDGTEVAVKIQRPGIEKTIRQDIHILYSLAGLAERFIPEWNLYRPKRIIKEFADWTLRELDFEMEGHNAERFRALFKENPDIHIPRIFWEWTGKRVLTMSFSHGVKADDLAGMEALGIDRKRLASIGVDAFFEQFLVAGFFHADPHPGNFFARPDGSLCLHDFGMVGYLDEDARRVLLHALRAFVKKDIEGFTKYFLRLAEIDDQSDVGAFKKDLAGILSEFFYSPRPPSAARAFFRAINQGTRNGIRFPSDLALFGKAILTTEGMGLLLDPQFDFNRELEPFVQKTWQWYWSPSRLLRTVEADLFDRLELLKEMPDRFNKVLMKLERGEIGVKFDGGDLRGIKEEFDRQNDLRILGLVLTAVALGTSGLLYLEGRRAVFGFPLSGFGIFLFSILLIWFFIRLRQGPGKPE